jgi:DNA-binding transcriptional MocR family regulator
VARSLFSSAEARLIPLGAALPDPAWLPGDALQRALHSAGRRLDAHGQSYSLPPGRRDLRSKIAARSAQWGARFGADDLIITAGATQALRLALRAVCQPGDVVAIEQPAYFGTLLLLEDLGLKALAIPTDPVEGLLLEPLADAIRCHRPAAVLASPTVQNPLGASMPVARKQELVALLEEAEIPLIEDDVYGDLVGEGQRPPACKAFDQSGNVIYCSSLSKTLAPGWRIGWIAAGRYSPQVLQARMAGEWAGAPLLEAATSEVLASGDYDRHLRRLKRRIAEGVHAVVAQVKASFPPERALTCPLPVSCCGLNCLSGSTRWRCTVARWRWALASALAPVFTCRRVNALSAAELRKRTHAPPAERRRTDWRAVSRAGRFHTRVSSHSVKTRTLRERWRCG